MRYRPPRHPPIGDVYLVWLALVLLVLLAIGAYCRQPAVSPDQPPRTPTVTVPPVATFTPSATITLPAPTATSTPAGPTSTNTATLTPLPTVTATQERRASEFSTPTVQPTLRSPFDPQVAPATPAPRQIPRRP